MSVRVELGGKEVVFGLSVQSGEVQLNIVSINGEELGEGGGVLWINKSGELNRFTEVSQKSGLKLNNRGEIKKGGYF